MLHGLRLMARAADRIHIYYYICPAVIEALTDKAPAVREVALHAMVEGVHSLWQAKRLIAKCLQASLQSTQLDKLNPQS